MPYLNDRSLDAALQVIVTEGSRLDICTAEPTSYAQATSTLSVGNKTGIAPGAVGDRSPNGRKTTIPAVVSGAPGAITGNGTATHWAITDPTNSRLLAAGVLSAGQVVVSGNTWTSTAFDIGLADAA